MRQPTSAAQSANISAEEVLQFDNTLDGTWDHVVGFVGFWHTFEDLGQMFVTIIGLPTQAEGNGRYTSQNWDKKIFWFDVGDGIPMHLPCSYIGDFVGEETGETYHAYYAPNLFIKREGVDYSRYEDESQMMEMFFYIDDQNNVLGYEVDLIGPDNQTVVETSQLQAGDQVQSWTLMLKIDEPDFLYMGTMEEGFRTVTAEPEFFYEHWTPNKDFPNPLTLDQVDFGDKDLLYLLGGEADGQNGEPERFLYSQPKDAKVKWDPQQVSGLRDWNFMK